MQVLSQSAGGVTAPFSALQSGPNGSLTRPAALRDGSVTLGALIDQYMAQYAGRDKTRTQRLGWWRDRLGSVTLADIDDDMVFDAMEALAARRGTYFMGRDANGAPIMNAKRKPLAAATLNRFQAALSAVLTWAQHRRIAPKGWHNPCRMLPMKPERNERVRFLTEDERERFLPACRESKWPLLYLFALMGLKTGARRGELEALTWADIDLDRGEAQVLHTKNNDKKMLPLVPEVVDELRRFQGSPTALVFASKRCPGQAFNLNPAWKEALQAAGIKDFRVHDLRHDCASRLARAGASLLEIGDLLGHRQQSVTKRYAHLCGDHKKALVNRLLGSGK
jgi:integrase